MRLFVAFVVALKAADAFAYSELPSSVPSSIGDLAILLGAAVIILGVGRQRNKN